MVWSAAVAVPLMSPFGYTVLAAAFLLGGAALQSRSRARWAASFGAFALALAPLAVIASVTVPHVFENGTPADADQVNENFEALAAGTPSSFDSGFVAVGPNQDVSFAHDLGTTAVVASLYFTPDPESDRVYGPAPLAWGLPVAASGAAIASLTETTVTVRTGADFRIPSAAPGVPGQELLASGFVRVVLMSVSPGR